MSNSNFTWSRCTPSEGGSLPPAARSGHTAVSVTSTLGGQEMVVIFGGVNNNRYFEDVNALVIDSPGTDPGGTPFACHWLCPSPAPGPGPRAFHCSAADGDKVYVFGGRNDHQQPRPDLWCLDTSTWQWTLIQPLTFPPSPRDFASLCAMGDGRLILFGGYDGKRWLSDVNIINTQSGEWSTVSIAQSPSIPAPLPRSGHSAAFIHNNLMIFGGESSNGAVLSDLWRLSHADGPGLPTWTSFRHPTGPSKRFGHCWALLKGETRLLLFGGQSEVMEGLLGFTKKEVWMEDLWVLDDQGAATSKWLRIVPPRHTEAPEGRAYHSFTPIASGSRVLLFGGFNGKFAMNDAWLLSSDFNALPPPSTPPAPQPLFRFSPVPLQAPDLLGEEVPVPPPSDAGLAPATAPQSSNFTSSLLNIASFTPSLSTFTDVVPNLNQIRDFGQRGLDTLMLRGGTSSSANPQPSTAGTAALQPPDVPAAAAGPAANGAAAAPQEREKAAPTVQADFQQAALAQVLLESRFQYGELWSDRGGDLGDLEVPYELVQYGQQLAKQHQGSSEDVPSSSSAEAEGKEGSPALEELPSLILSARTALSTASPASLTLAALRALLKDYCSLVQRNGLRLTQLQLEREQSAATAELAASGATPAKKGGKKKGKGKKQAAARLEGENGGEGEGDATRDAEGDTSTAPADSERVVEEEAVKKPTPGLENALAVIARHDPAKISGPGRFYDAALKAEVQPWSFLRVSDVGPLIEDYGRVLELLGLLGDD